MSDLIQKNLLANAQHVPFDLSCLGVATGGLVGHGGYTSPAPAKSSHVKQYGPEVAIGLIGKKGSGKSQSAKFIVDHLPGATAIAFADPLRAVCNRIFGVTYAEMGDDRSLKEKELERYPFQSPRTILQTVGAECIRSQYPDAWIECWKRTVSTFKGPSVTQDTRFLNEYDAIRERGGFIIKIIRPELEAIPTHDRDLHPSETVQESLVPDRVIINDGSLALLQARVLVAVMELLEGKGAPSAMPVESLS